MLYKALADLLKLNLYEEFLLNGDDTKYRFTDTSFQFLGDDGWEDSIAYVDIINGSKSIKYVTLSDNEREYLKVVVRPFRNHVVSVRKIIDDWNCTQLVFRLRNDGAYEDMGLIVGEADEGYQNLKLGREYTLEELDI